MSSAIRFVRWRDESETIQAGLSDDARVLPLTSVGPNLNTIGDVVSYCRSRQLNVTSWCRQILQQHVERINVAAERYVIPVDLSELWASGVTYDLSRDAREAETTAGQTIYAKVYNAIRPELFFKAVGHRVKGPNEPLMLRSDARWHVPEPELTMILDEAGAPIGYTVGNDLTARDLEAENPLYLPQAKIFDGSASIGPTLVLADTIDPLALSITLEIRRKGQVLFAAEESTQRLRRSLSDLVSYLTFAYSVTPWTGLMTGTGIVPPDEVSLIAGDEVLITIPEIGTLRNTLVRMSP